MKSVSRVVLSGVATAALICAGAGAATAAGPLEFVEWDTSTCATEGAASPKVSYTDDSSLPMSVVHSFGIDDQDGYDSIRTGPGPGTVTQTLGPVRAGEHVVYEQNRDPSGPRGAQISVTAPACASGSPEPTDLVWPKEAALPADLSATFGDPTCGGEGFGDDVPVLPFDYTNAGEGEGRIDVVIDEAIQSGSDISAGADGSHGVIMEDGTHTYELRDGDGAVLDSAEATAPECPADAGTGEPGSDEPTTDEPSTGQPTTGQPTTDQPTTDQPAAVDAGSSDAGTDNGTTPVIPAVVQTDSHQADHSPLTPAALALFVALLAAGAVRAARGSGD